MTSPSGGLSGLRVWWPVVAWAGAILVLTTLRVPASAWEPPGGVPWDKAVHFGVYAGLGRAAASSLLRSGRPSGAGWWLAAAAAIVFAGLDELHQRWIPGRAPSVGDFAADVAGLLVGLAAGRLLPAGGEERTVTEGES